MRLTKSKLDIPFAELVKEATNKETPRQFIRNTESEFGIEELDIDNMSEDELNRYADYLDDLWGK